MRLSIIDVGYILRGCNHSAKFLLLKRVGDNEAAIAAKGGSPITGSQITDYRLVRQSRKSGEVQTEAQTWDVSAYSQIYRWSTSYYFNFAIQSWLPRGSFSDQSMKLADFCLTGPWSWVLGRKMVLGPCSWVLGRPITNHRALESRRSPDGYRDCHGIYAALRFVLGLLSLSHSLTFSQSVLAPGKDQATKTKQRVGNNYKQTEAMFEIKGKKVFISRTLILVFITLLFSSCGGQATEKSAKKSIEKADDTQNNQPLNFNRTPIFPQVHSNLNGMVGEFVRKMFQDSRGTIWFGTNGDGIICYNGQTLEKISSSEWNKYIAVRGIVEDKAGNVWFGTSDGLIKFDGKNFTNFSEKDGLLNEEIWGLAIDKNGLIWVGTIEGVCHFDGQRFTAFPLPETTVENPQHMLSDKLVKRILEDKNGNMWYVTDGNGIFKYNEGEFTHLTNKNGLTDNNAADILEDSKGNIWIGTFYGGVSKYDGNTYTNFTQDGVIEGIETYNFCEDSQGNIWFSAENYGVYKYDGVKFTRYTTEDGLATNGIQSIYEDDKGQLWFCTWQGISLYDGKTFMDVSEKEPWTK